jgi:hypothetical protein
MSHDTLRRLLEPLRQLAALSDELEGNCEEVVLVQVSTSSVRASASTCSRVDSML